MVKRLLVAGFGLIVAAGVAIAAQPPQAARPGAPPGQAETVVKLSLNQDVEVDARGTRVKLRMTDIKDSRCPSDVVCIRAGEATATISVTPLAPGQMAGTVMVQLPGQPQTAGGVTLTLQAVEPYPKASQPTPPAQIVATVGVAKAG